MVEELGVSRALVARATWLPQAAGARRQWDGRSGVCRDVRPHTASDHGQQSSFQAKAQPATAHRTRPYWTTDEICRVPVFPLQVIAWEKEAARVTFALDPVLLADTAHRVIPRVTGEVVSTGRSRLRAPPRLCTRRCLCMHSTRRSRESASPLSPPCPSAIPCSTTSPWCCRPRSPPRMLRDSCTPRRWPMRSWSTSSDVMPPRGKPCAR